MTEREKMLSGEFYDTTDTELRAISNKAKRLMYIYNSVVPENNEKRKEVLKQLLGSVGENVRVNQPFYVDYGCNIYLGDNSFINLNCTFLDTNKIVIGERTIIAPDVKIYTAYHDLNGYKRRDKKTKRLLTKSEPVVIGDDCWIGGNTVILAGVKIGNNVTIGANSLVKEDLPDNVIACGNPCTVKRKNE